MAIAIIGAGLAGLTAARHLADAGRSVVVFDKSRGLGGRLATRRHGAGPFNHGAPWVRAQDPAFAVSLEGAARAGVARREGDRWIGVPGMSALVRPLAEGLDLRLGGAVQTVRASGEAFDLLGEAGPLGRFERVICAIPVVQARQVLADAIDTAPLAHAAMAPCWTVLAVFDGLPADPGPTDDILGDPIAQPGPPGRWVAHASPDWSVSHLEDPTPDVQQVLAEALQRRLGLGAPIVAMAHRWRYARTATPLGRAFHDAGGRVFVGGDWALGPDAGHAFAIR